MSLLPADILYQPVHYNGQEYLTSYYFHRQYRMNAGMQGKYRRHRDFVRLLRSMEAYALYSEQGDVVELHWTRIKAEGAQILRTLQPLFQAAGYQSLVLLNATAQVALSNHLDDELSKQMSVAANTTIARQATRKNGDTATPAELGARDFAAWLDVAKLLQTPIHIAQQEAAKAIEASYGVDFRPLLKGVVAQETIQPDDEMYEPTDLAKFLGFSSGQQMNRILQGLGLQYKSGDTWVPTAKGT